MQYVGIQTQQSRNNLRSAFLLFLFPCLVAALLYLSCYLLVLFGYGKSMEIEIMPMVNHFFLSSLPYTMGIVIIWFLIAYWANTSIINSATGSKPLDRIENKRVYNLFFMFLNKASSDVCRICASIILCTTEISGC